MVDRTHRELTDENIACIAEAYYIWCLPDNEAGREEEISKYSDVSGFCKLV